MAPPQEAKVKDRPRYFSRTASSSARVTGSGHVASPAVLSLPTTGEALAASQVILPRRMPTTTTLAHRITARLPIVSLLCTLIALPVVKPLDKPNLGGQGSAPALLSYRYHVID